MKGSKFQDNELERRSQLQGRLLEGFDRNTVFDTGSAFRSGRSEVHSDEVAFPLVDRGGDDDDIGQDGFDGAPKSKFTGGICCKGRGPSGG